MVEQSPLWKEEVEDVDAAIYEAVEKGLNHFGPTFKNVVFHELRKFYNVDPNSISRKPEIFSEFLDRVFSIGAYRIKQVIIQEIGLKFSLPSEREFDLAAFIIKIKRQSRS